MPASTAATRVKRRDRVEGLAAWFRPRTGALAGQGTVRLTQEWRLASAQALISAFYAVLLFFAVSDLFSWQEYLSATSLTPRWPVFWLRYVDVRFGVGLILWFRLAGGLIGITLSRHRGARILVCLSLLEFLAFKYSFGAVNHGDHLGLLLTFGLVFLPSGWSSSQGASRIVEASTLLVFSGCQAFIMLTYSMSGMWKVGGVVQQVIQGQVSYVAPQGLAQQVAAKLLSDGSTSLLGPWLIDHPWAGWPLMIAALYLELFALWAVPRPTLHRVWGLGLILLHLSTHLTMGVGFPQNVLWLSLFFVLSPLRQEGAGWREMARDLPLLGRWLAPRA